MIKIHQSVRDLEWFKNIPINEIVEKVQQFYQNLSHKELEEILLNLPDEECIDESWTLVYVKDKKMYMRSNKKDLNKKTVDVDRTFFWYSTEDQKYSQCWIDRTDNSISSIPENIKNKFKPLVEYLRTIPGYLECTDLYFSKHCSAGTHIHGDENFKHFNIVVNITSSKEGSMVCILDEVIDLSNCRGFVFNGTLSHKAWNAGDEPWYMLVIAFNDKVYNQSLLDKEG